MERVEDSDRQAIRSRAQGRMAIRFHASGIGLDVCLFLLALAMPIGSGLLVWQRDSQKVADNQVEGRQSRDATAAGRQASVASAGRAESDFQESIAPREGASDPRPVPPAGAETRRNIPPQSDARTRVAADAGRQAGPSQAGQETHQSSDRPPVPAAAATSTIPPVPAGAGATPADSAGTVGGVIRTGPGSAPTSLMHAHHDQPERPTNSTTSRAIVSAMSPGPAIAAKPAVTPAPIRPVNPAGTAASPDNAASRGAAPRASGQAIAGPPAPVLARSRPPVPTTTRSPSGPWTGAPGAAAGTLGPGAAGAGQGNLVRQSASGPGKPPPPGLVVSLNPDLEKVLTGAWAMIEQGTIEAARRTLSEAAKSDSDDIRALFSLGLVDAVLLHDWPSAEKHFAECARRKPDNVPSLNNLALVELRTRHEARAVTHWSAALAEYAVPPEIAQNLGRVQALLAAKRARLKDSSIKTLDEISTAAATSGHGFHPRSGFRYMGLLLADGRTVGWSAPQYYDDVWCFACHGNGQVPCPDPACARGGSRRSRLQQGPCPTCGGETVVACPACLRGKDKDLKQSGIPPGQALPAELRTPAPRAPVPGPFPGARSVDSAPGAGFAPMPGAGYPLPVPPGVQNLNPSRRGR